MRILIVEDDAALSSFIRRDWKRIPYVDVANEGTRVVRCDGVGLRLVVLDLNLPESTVVGAEKSAAAEGKFAGDDPHGAEPGRGRVQCLDSGRTTIWSSHFFSRTVARARRYCGAVICVGIGAHGARPLPGSCATQSRAEWRSIELTTKEFALLEYLMRNAGGGSQGR